MKNMNSMKNATKLLFIAAVLASSTAAQAQVAGTWLVRGGITGLMPSVDSGDLTTPSLAGTKIGVGNSTRLSGGVSYMLGSHFSVDVPLALPFEHSITGDGAIAGAGQIGKVKAVPATVILQWRALEPRAMIRPYVGVGLTYADFYGARGNSTLTAITGGTINNPTTISVQSKFTATMQVGATFAVGKGWFVDSNYTYTPLRTSTSLSTGQFIDATLNPSSLSVAVGLMF